MTEQALNLELTRDPFVPLRLTLSNGESVDIFNPGATVISQGAVYLFSITRDGGRIADDTRLVSLRHIAQVERLQTA